MLLRSLCITLILCFSANCASLPSKVDDARAVAQSQLNAVLVLAKQAEDVTEYVCEIQPDGEPCHVLTDALDRVYAASVYVQDTIDRGGDVSKDLEALYNVVLKLVHMAGAAKRMIA